MKKSPVQEIATGIIHMHSKGFGFVILDKQREDKQDIFIPKHLTHNAIDGDRVEVAINPKRKKGKGPEGAVERIIERGKKQVVGTVFDLDQEGYHLYVPSLGKAKAAYVKKKKEAFLFLRRSPPLRNHRLG